MAFWRAIGRWIRGPGVTEQRPAPAADVVASPAAITMTPEIALRSVPLFRAVELISTTIASMPVRVLARQPDGSRTQLDPPMLAAVWRKPNAEQNRVEFFAQLMRHLLVWGDAFLYVIPSRIGEPSELWLVEPDRVAVGRDDAGRRLYIIDGRRDWPRYDWSSGSPRPGIVHIRSGSIDGIRGRGPVLAALESLGISRAAELFAARYFANAGVVSNIVYYNSELSEDEAKSIADQFTLRHTGAYQHRVVVLDSRFKVETQSQDAQAMQLLEVRRFGVTEVARLFGIPPHLLADASQSTSWGSGLEEQNRAFVSLTLRPWIALVEASLTDAFCSFDDSLAIRFDTSQLIQGSTKDRYSAYAAARMAGLLTINEIRDMEDLPAIGADGDSVLVPMNMTPVSAGSSLGVLPD